MKDPTNKELLEIILLQTKENAEKQASFAGQVSSFMNEQRGFNNNQILLNAEIKGFFESNPRTNQKGIIEQTQINTKDISDIKTGMSVNHAKKTLIGVGLGAVLTFLAKMLF
jgi:hypothetical protein|tara:strand:+ start:783 stop:1118 length:336 start_codon:yes stop_codon:yes gene_type:complete